jgi:hypothetical protein
MLSGIMLKIIMLINVVAPAFTPILQNFLTLGQHVLAKPV